MRLLIVSQAVDLDCPVLGFMHRWIEEFSRRFDSIEVICLKEGRHDLPLNVRVHSLGKESGASRFKYVLNFYRYIWKLRKNYDAVFVHMNQEYVLMGSPLWKLYRKRVYLWRNHYAGSFLTDLAVAWCNKVFCTSGRSYTARFKKTEFMPIGIDTDFFAPQNRDRPEDSILFLGRLDPAKRCELLVDALQLLYDENIPFVADIIGDPSVGNELYAHDLRNRAATLALEGMISMHPGISNNEARNVFASHEIYINLSPSGMFDKTIGEAMACGCIVVAVNDALRDIVPKEFMAGETPETVAYA